VNRAPGALLCAALAAGCSAQRSRPSGPPPEYELPVVTAWDAGTRADPLESAEESGQWVDEPTEDAALRPLADAAEN
jgi:hypothetical protein